jgi:hypothetical protein
MRLAWVGTVETLAEYFAGATRKFLAAANGKIFDISASGAVGAPLATGFTSNQWQQVSFLSRLFLANGHDTLQIYDGATVANSTFTGVTLSTLVAGFQYQNRIFFWQNNSTGFWYAPLNSISGLLKFFDLAAFTPRGGNLVAMTTYSADGGTGVQNFAVFIMSSGDCLIYFGNDPGDPMNWSLVGIYALSPPLGPRAVVNYGSEAFLTTYDDHIPLKAQLTALRDGSLPARSKVSGAVQAAVVANSGAFGWQALYYPKGPQADLQRAKSGRHVLPARAEHQRAVSGSQDRPAGVAVVPLHKHECVLLGPVSEFALFRWRRRHRLCR